MDYFVRLIDMPPAVRSFIKENSDHISATIVINARLSREQQQEQYVHEVGHMERNDFEKDDVNQIETKAHRTQKNRPPCGNRADGVP